MYQKVIIVGNLGRDPELRYMPDGTAVTNMSVATNRTWKNRQTGEQEEEVTWFRVSVWGAQAEPCNQYLSKGRRVLVEGALQPDKETGGPRLFTRQDGSVGASYELRAYTVKFLGGESESGGASAPPAGGYNNPIPEEEDDIPF